MPETGDARLRAEGPDSVVYKTVNEATKLSIHFTYPEGYRQKEQWPLIVFYHGGGWNQGTWRHFRRQARYFSKLGFVCALPEYRVRSRHGTTPFASLMDAKSALRYLKGHASDFRIDTSRIIASGGSAGGHLAAALDVVDGYNDPKDDLTISTKVDALALFNPVLDTSAKGYGYRRVRAHYRTFSPLHQPKDNAAPTLIMLGSEDKLIPVKTANKYCSQLESSDTPCEVVIYNGQEHGFFNREPFLTRTVNAMERFLGEQGFLE